VTDRQSPAETLAGLHTLITGTPITPDEAFDWLNPDQPAETEGMFDPVRCTCGGIYDLGKVTVTARYTDCSVWTTPCCRRSVDDRGETGWTSRRDYTRLRPS
jgi:hypothetical protein